MKLLTSSFLLTLIFSVSAASQTSLKIGSPAPAFSAKSLAGEIYGPSEMRGKVVVLTFWSTRCEICRSEIPRLNLLTDRYEGGNVIFLALTTEHADKIGPFLRRNPFKFQILPDSFGTLLQYADRQKNGYIDMGYPSFFVIDQEGRVGYRSSGYDKTDALDTAIGRLVSR